MFAPPGREPRDRLARKAFRAPPLNAPHAARGDPLSVLTRAVILAIALTGSLPVRAPGQPRSQPAVKVALDRHGAPSRPEPGYAWGRSAGASLVMGPWRTPGTANGSPRHTRIR